MDTESSTVKVAIGYPVLSISDGLDNVTLQQGVFQFTVQMPAADYDRVFTDPSQKV